MASVHREVVVDAQPDHVWAAIRDFGAVERLVPGFVLDCRLDAEQNMGHHTSGKVGCGRPCAWDQLRNSGGNSFSAPQAEQVALSTATRCLGSIPDAITKPQFRNDSRCAQFRTAAVQQIETFASTAVSDGARVSLKTMVGISIFTLVRADLLGRRARDRRSHF